MMLRAGCLDLPAAVFAAAANLKLQRFWCRLQTFRDEYALPLRWVQLLKRARNALLYVA